MSVNTETTNNSYILDQGMKVVFNKEVNIFGD